MRRLATAGDPAVSRSDPATRPFPGLVITQKKPAGTDPAGVFAMSVSNRQNTMPRRQAFIGQPDSPEVH
jgi:hypothetical protein